MSCDRSSNYIAASSPVEIAELTDTPHGRHSKTLMSSFRPRQTVPTCTMGSPHVGQGIGCWCEFGGAISNDIVRARYPALMQIKRLNQRPLLGTIPWDRGGPRVASGSPSALHSRAVLSYEAVRMRLPSGENTTVHSTLMSGQVCSLPLRLPSRTSKPVWCCWSISLRNHSARLTKINARAKSPGH